VGLYPQIHCLLRREQFFKVRILTLLYIFIPKLTQLIIDKLIDHIEVESQEVVDGQRQQEIRIVWRFAEEV
jgi:hypothetical protein